MYKILIAYLTVCFIFSTVNGQDHFLVELEDRSPDAKALVQSYEGYPLIPILANDYKGNEISLMDLKGKPVILWFWNTQCPKCIEQIDALNLIKQKYGTRCHLISFADEDKAAITQFANSKPIDFSVIASSKTLSEGPYGAELGYPKLFIIDEFGIIKWVIPEMEMKSNFDAFNFLETIIISLEK